jgi:hypothetical protein
MGVKDRLERVKNVVQAELWRQKHFYKQRKAQRESQRNKEKAAYAQEYRKAKIRNMKLKARRQARADVNKPSLTERLSKVAKPNSSPFAGFDLGLFGEPKQRKKRSSHKVKHKGKKKITIYV